MNYWLIHTIQQSPSQAEALTGRQGDFHTLNTLKPPTNADLPPLCKQIYRFYQNVDDYGRPCLLLRQSVKRKQWKRLRQRRRPWSVEKIYLGHKFYQKFRTHLPLDDLVTLVPQFGIPANCGCDSYWIPPQNQHKLSILFDQSISKLGFVLKLFWLCSQHNSFLGGLRLRLSVW